MDTPKLIPLSLIVPNPYQKPARDEAKVLEIAESLKHHRENGSKGLLQIPVARAVNGHYELSFGHHRFYAFQHRTSLGEDFFAEMPLLIKDLNDQEMFEEMADENFRRRNPGSIEKANLISDYMTKFKKTSAETAAFFQMSPESVRDLIRLLKLPKELQDGVEDGTINRENARRLLTVQRAAPNQVKNVARDLKAHPNADPDTVIANALRNSGNTVEMYVPSWRQETEILAGANLWPLRMPADKFPTEYLPDLKVNDAAKTLGIDLTKGNGNRIRLEGWIKGLIGGEGTWVTTGAGIHKIEGDVKESLVEVGAPIETLERLEHLIRPPACSACPYYARVNSMHFCTFKECYTRKASAWRGHVLAEAVEQLGIRQYDHKTDGKYVSLNTYTESHNKLVKERHADLRLKKGSNNGSWNGVPEGFAIVAVGETAEKLLKKEQAPTRSNGQEESYRAEQKRLAQMREANREAAYDFLWNVGTSAFGGLLQPLDNLPFVKEFADRIVRGVPAEEPDAKAKKADRLDFYRRALLFSLLDDVLDMWDICQQKTPVTAMAKELRGLATTWGVKLPKNWLDQAAQADAVIAVTAVTES